MRAFGQRLCVDKNGLKLRARGARRELRRFIRRPEWQTEEGDEETLETGKMTAKTTKNVDALAATTTTAVDAVVEGMKSTPARTVVDGKSKFVLQLFPLDAETSGRMKARGYNPLMELTFRQKKSVSGLIAHLSEKWTSMRRVRARITFYNCTRLNERADCGPWNATIEGATALDVFNALGEPACFRVRYAWADRTTALASRLKTPQQKTVSGTKRKSSSAFTLGGFSVETSAFDPIPGDTPAVKASAPVANASVSRRNFQGMGLTNMFAPSMDAHARQLLARLGNSPSKPPPLSRIFASPAKKGCPPCALGRIFASRPTARARERELLDEPIPALGVITDSLINPGDSLFRDAILGGGDTRSRRRATDATKGPTSFAECREAPPRAVWCHRANANALTQTTLNLVLLLLLGRNTVYNQIEEVYSTTQ